MPCYRVSSGARVGGGGAAFAERPPRYATTGLLYYLARAYRRTNLPTYMNKHKIINDPVYGFISVPYELIFDLIEHPYFQRLRRIKQLGLTHYVFPGAQHTRFHHALGAMHLMQKAIRVLQYKGVDITPQEAEATTVAILLHDIGHGPFSHALEHTVVNVHHEDLSVLFMEELNATFGGALGLAIEIFQNRYPKHFLHQLVSSQLDMDRMDYLNRDSFFTGVSEGVIGYDRIIKMLNVHDDQIVVEYKGIYSIEKFLIARRIMYWQVYLHKTVLSAEHMLIQVLRRVKQVLAQGQDVPLPASLAYFVRQEVSLDDFRTHRKTHLDAFARIDDTDITYLLKSLTHHPDYVLSFLSQSLLDRRLFKVVLQNAPFTEAQLAPIRAQLRLQYPHLTEAQRDMLLILKAESNAAYSTKKAEIKCLMKDGTVKGLLDASDHAIDSQVLTKYFICYPKPGSLSANAAPTV